MLLQLLWVPDMYLMGSSSHALNGNALLYPQHTLLLSLRSDTCGTSLPKWGVSGAVALP